VTVHTPAPAVSASRSASVSEIHVSQQIIRDTYANLTLVFESMRRLTSPRFFTGPSGSRVVWTFGFLTPPSLTALSLSQEDERLLEEVAALTHAAPAATPSPAELLAKSRGNTPYRTRVGVKEHPPPPPDVTAGHREDDDLYSYDI